MPKQEREKIGEMPCKVCKSVIDVKAQRNGVAYAHCFGCGVRHTGGLNSPQKLGGLEEHGARCVHLEQTTINMNGGLVNGTLNGNAKVAVEVKESNKDDDDWF